MGIGDQIERQIKRDIADVLGSLLKVLIAAIALFWPIALIDGKAFAPHPNWWQYALGGLAEVAWLALVGLVYWGSRPSSAPKPKATYKPRPEIRRAQATVSPPAKRARKRSAYTGMGHEKVYGLLESEVLHDLDTATDLGHLDRLTDRSVAKLREAMATVPEFYAGEFFDRLRSAVMNAARSEPAKCERALTETQARAAEQTAALNCQLNAARKTGDQAAQHQVWKELEQKQKAVQVTLNSAQQRIDLITKWPGVIRKMASELGVRFG